MCTKFQQCGLLNYFVTVDLVTSPKITALLHHSAYVIVHGKVIKMEHLNESQLRAQAVRLIEENYGYSATAKKVGCSKAWVGKWAKTNAAESKRARVHTSKITITWLKTNVRHYISSEHWPTICQICLQLKTFGALWLQLFMPAQSREH